MSVCIHCCMLLRVVRSCCTEFEIGQMLSNVHSDVTFSNIAWPLNNVGSCYKCRLHVHVALGVYFFARHFAFCASLKLDS